jgi:hypothetical protein
VARECVLGSPESRIYVHDFCGRDTVGDVTETSTFMKWGRDLDDDSEVELTLHLQGDAASECCELLNKIRTWRNEISIVRGGEVVWGPGPIVTIYVQRHIAHIVARDITAWLDVRLVHSDYTFDEVDMSTVAENVVRDALTQGGAASLPKDTRDACILEFARFEPAGKPVSMEVKANRRTAGEVLRELATKGLDFTVVNRSLIVGADFAFGPVAVLRDEHFQEDLMIGEHGLAAATKWHVSSDHETGQAGGPDAFYGLIERGVEGQPAATSKELLEGFATDRLHASNPPPLVVTVPQPGRLAPSAPVCPRSLVPGALVDLSIRDLCRPATVRERITAVRFTVDDKGETPSITLAPALTNPLVSSEGG